MTWLYVLLGVLFGFLIITFAFAYMIFYRSIKRKKPRKEDINDIFSQNKIDAAGKEELLRLLKWETQSKNKTVCIESEDGLRLFCTLINAPSDREAKGVVIAFHGYGSYGARDFCLQLPMLHEAGYHVMLVDQRTHARSEGKYICYGAKESRDAILWRKKASEIYGNELPIAFYGVSMGAATVIMASGLVESEDSQVKCVVADCPYYSPYTIIKHVLWRYNKIHPQPIIHFVNFWSRFIADFNMRAPSCVEMAKDSTLPILLIHGKEDKFVPTECSVKIAEELGDRVKLVLFDEAKHAESVYYDKERYKAELVGFLDKYMQ